MSSIGLILIQATNIRDRFVSSTSFDALTNVLSLEKSAGTTKSLLCDPILTDPQNQAFSPAQIRDILPVFYSKARQLSDIFVKLATPPVAAKAPAAVDVPPKQLDVLSWLSRATLDAIGLAGKFMHNSTALIRSVWTDPYSGFGYTFHSLDDDNNELAKAFSAIFAAARNIRVLVILQIWFPWLKRFVSDHVPTFFGYLHTYRRRNLVLLKSSRRRVPLGRSGPVL